MLYLIKVNLTLALLCLLFQVVMHRDTFFGVRRLMLWGIYLTAFLLPLWDVQALLSGRAATMHLATDYAAYVLPTLDVTATNIATLGIRPSEPGCGMWFVGVMILWAVVYLVPVVWLSLRLLMQIAYLIYLRYTCSPIPDLSREGGITIYLYPRPCSPFSFGPWIFLHPEGMDEQTLREVLIHEQTHVRQWHTLDILFAELVCILFWWNPAAWVMRREVRMNLEFLADKAVANLFPHDGGGREGAVKAYQYRLLGFSTQANVATIANNFNVLPLKRRISMMNLRRTRRTGMVKYALFVPVAAALLLFSNVDALARRIGPSQVASSDSVYNVVDVLPEYKGGMDALSRHLMTTVKYPTVAHEWGVQGRVIVNFVVETDGTLSEVKATQVQDVHTGKELPEVVITAYENTDEQALQRVEHEVEGVRALKAEAERAVKNLPERWTPGSQDGNPVRVRFNLPVVFRLQ